MGKIRYNTKKNKLEYDEPPFDQTFVNMKLVEAILNADPDILAYLVKNMTNESKRSFLRFTDLDSKLKEKVAAVTATQLESKITKIGPIDPNEVVDQLLVNIAPIFSIVLMTDGSRYVETKPNDIESLVLFEDWEKIHGEKIEVLLETLAQQRITELERVIEIVKAKPIRMENDLFTADGIVHKTVIVYHPSQYAAYLAKIGAGVMIDANAEVEPEPNERNQQ